MKNSKPIRTCIYTKIKDFKYNLIRLVTNENSEYVLDKTQKIQKRGIYIYPSEKSLFLLEKHKKYKISKNNIEEIRKEIIEKIKVGEINVK